MMRNLTAMILPGRNGQANVVVHVMDYPHGIDGEPKITATFRGHLDHPMEIPDREVRQWVNNSIRAIARLLEEDLYEAMRVAPERLTFPGADT
jgi:hypothetical protein